MPGVGFYETKYCRGPKEPRQAAAIALCYLVPLMECSYAYRIAL